MFGSGPVGGRLAILHWDPSEAALPPLGPAFRRLEAFVAAAGSESVSAAESTASADSLAGESLGEQPSSADAALLVFTLSAAPPGASMARLLASAAAALRPGGVLLLRDYGERDMAQMRFRGWHAAWAKDLDRSQALPLQAGAPADRERLKLGHQHEVAAEGSGDGALIKAYLRGDGTRAYFFSAEEVRPAC